MPRARSSPKESALGRPYLRTQTCGDLQAARGQPSIGSRRGGPAGVLRQARGLRRRSLHEGRTRAADPDGRWPGELRSARWTEIDESRSLWRIPAERMKMDAEHLVPLSTQALSLLQDLRRLNGAHELVLPSPFYPGKPLSDGTLNSALARLGYKGIATAHGFRTLFSTCANEAGWNSDVIEKQLSHEERDDVRGAYNRAQWLPERLKLMQWWANHLQALRTSSAPSTRSRNASLQSANSRDGKGRRKRPHPSQSADAGGRGTTRAATPAPTLRAAIGDPIEALRALIAAFDQSSTRTSR